MFWYNRGQLNQRKYKYRTSNEVSGKRNARRNYNPAMTIYDFRQILAMYPPSPVLPGK